LNLLRRGPTPLELAGLIYPPIICKSGVRPLFHPYMSLQLIRRLRFFAVLIQIIRADIMEHAQFFFHFKNFYKIAYDFLIRFINFKSAIIRSLLKILI